MEMIGGIGATLAWGHKRKFFARCW